MLAGVVKSKAWEKLHKAELVCGEEGYEERKLAGWDWESEFVTNTDREEMWSFITDWLIFVLGYHVVVVEEELHIHMTLSDKILLSKCWNVKMEELLQNKLLWQWY